VAAVDLSQLNFFDLYSGRLICSAGNCGGGGALSLGVEAAGFGAVLATTHTADSDKELGELLMTMRNFTGRKRSTLSSRSREMFG
jgi:hypothetical protein